MNVASHLVVWCSVVVCANPEANLTARLRVEDEFDVSSLEDDDDFDFGPDLRFLHDFEDTIDDNSTSVNGTDRSESVTVKSETGKNQSDLQNDGSERVATPVAFSYSSSSNPRTSSRGGTRVVVNHPNNVGHSQFTKVPPARYRSRTVPATSYTHALVPMIYHSQQPLQTTLEGERHTANQQEVEEPSHPQSQQYEEDDGGGGEETEDEEDEESSDGEEEYDEEEEQPQQRYDDKRTVSKDYDDYSYPDGNQEGSEASAVVKQKKDPETVAKEFLEEYDPGQLHDKYSKGDSTKEFQVQEEVLPLKRPKKHQKVEDGLDKVLQKPLKFAYSEDSSPAASGHKQHHKGGKIEQGGGEEGHADHHSSHGKKGDKGYKGYHKYEKGQKGHHDKETKEKEYSDHKGKKAKHKDAAGHYGESVKGEKGKKAAEYEEKGEHKKGHSTKGEHNIHKKDEYVKKHEFYDEHHEGGEHEKHGGYHEKHGEKKGGKYKKGHKKAGYHDDHHGKKGHHEKGGHHDEHKGHKEKSGHDEHHAHAEKYGKKHGHKEGKKWHFDKKER